MKNSIIGGKEAEELNGKGVGRIVFMELKLLSVMTGVVFGKRGSEAGAKIFKE